MMAMRLMKEAVGAMIAGLRDSGVASGDYELEIRFDTEVGDSDGFGQTISVLCSGSRLWVFL